METGNGNGNKKCTNEVQCFPHGLMSGVLCD